ncbi:MAG: helicase-related protein, partial [Planctomycetota bacterium]
AARRDTLAAIAAGQADVVIGTRSAVFAPCPRLGLIVVDEEQEGSFKNLAAPFYHARDVAIKRGQLENIPVVLGSATPALETWHNAHTLPHFELLRLPERVPGAELPQTRIVGLRSPSRPSGGATAVRRGRAAAADASEERADTAARLLSPELAQEVRDTLAAGEQSILLLNRRGYAAFLRCERCGLLVTCERCGSHMVLHSRAAGARGSPGEAARTGSPTITPSSRTGSAAPTTPAPGGAGGAPRCGVLKCHRCGAQRPVPPACLDSTCGGRLARAGSAIQRLEEELHATLPAARVLRLDSDTMRRRDDYRAALSAFETGSADVLIGTQMVAKGLDFPRVRLVGVLDADAALALPDFRAAERVFQLVVQVVGRAGRRSGASLAIVQTSAGRTVPPAIEHALQLDYEAFAAEELAARQRFFYPPAARLARLILADSRPGHARDEVERVAAALTERAGRLNADLRVDPAAPCIIRRLREMLRYEIVLRSPRAAGPGALHTLLRAVMSEKTLRPNVQRVTIDLDPLDLF